MNICPLCNALQKTEVKCASCGKPLEDCGKLTDYFDDYSAYMEIDDLKKIDGFTTTLSEYQCAHLFFCTACNNGEVKLIAE